MNTFQHAALTERIIGSAMKVHRVLGPGFLESVYQKSLAYELTKNGLTVRAELRIEVTYETMTVGDFVADMLVDGCVLIENKAVRNLSPAHEAQLVHYLTATGLNVGLLFNFGAPSLQFKRKSRLYSRGGSIL